MITSGFFYLSFPLRHSCVMLGTLLFRGVSRFVSRQVLKLCRNQFCAVLNKFQSKTVQLKTCGVNVWRIRLLVYEKLSLERRKPLIRLETFPYFGPTPLNLTRLRKSVGQYHLTLSKTFGMPRECSQVCFLWKGIRNRKIAVTTLNRHVSSSTNHHRHITH